MSSWKKFLHSPWGFLTGANRAEEKIEHGMRRANELAQGYLNNILSGSRGATASAQGMMSPYMDAGRTSLNSLMGLMQDPSSVTKTPMYQFQLGEGMDAINSSAAATGMSGNTLKALSQFGQGLASQSYQQQVQNLSGLSQMGQQAATQAGSYGMQGSQMDSIAQQNILQNLLGGIYGSTQANASNTAGFGGLLGGIMGTINAVRNWNK